jgi:bacterioferritin-associated ferredoxin
MFFFLFGRTEAQGTQALADRAPGNCCGDIAQTPSILLNGENDKRKPATAAAIVLEHPRAAPSICAGPTPRSSMIVCSCNVLSDHEIRLVAMAAREPALSPCEVHQCFGCRVQCGRCARSIRRIIADAATARSSGRA